MVLMFEQLAGAIEEVQIPVDRVAVVEAVRLADRLGAKISLVVGELDERFERRPGEPSLTTWLRRQARLSYADAERLVFVARRLRSWPLTRRAWLDGVLTAGQVGALVTTLSDNAVIRYAGDEREVVPALIGLTVRDTAAAVRRWLATGSPNGIGPYFEADGDEPR
jgi:hypothetical protein